MSSDIQGSRGSRSFTTSFEQALAQLKKASGLAVRTGAMASMLATPIAGAIGCVNDANEIPPGPIFTTGDTATDGFLDYQGTRDTNMVSYTGDSWHEFYDCNTRGGCMGVAVFLKLRVQPVAGATIDNKRVGVVYRSPGGEPVTAVGSYFSTLGDGAEEWHVRIDRRSWDSGVFRFDAWYQDGTANGDSPYGNTYFDDNNGEAHVANYHGSYAVIRHFWDAAEGLTVDGSGVHGRLSFYVADLDYDKDIRMIWTTDGWQTINEFGFGDGWQTENVMMWQQDLWNGYERWSINVNIAETTDRFEYAVVYRHGVVNDAEVYEFWDNNGGHNYVVTPVE
jgi:hypothetical protein